MFFLLLHTLSSLSILLFYLVKGKLLAQVLAEMFTFELEKLALCVCEESIRVLTRAKNN